MINVLIWILIMLFAAKQIFTILGPTSIIGRYKESGGKSHRWSFGPPVEIILLLGATVLANISKKDQWFNKPMILAIYGLIATVITYVLVYIVAVIVSFAIKKIDVEIQKEEAGAKKTTRP